MKFRFVIPVVLVGVGMGGCAAPYQTDGAWGNSVGSQTPSIGGSTGIAAVATPILIQILMQQLGISQQQAFGGVGSIFSVAQQQLTPAQFGQLSSSVPEMNQYLAAAPAIANSTGGYGGLLGSAVTALGGQGTTLGGAASLIGAFQSLGMDSNMVGRFVPIVMNHIQSEGGPVAMGLLQSSLY